MREFLTPSNVCLVLGVIFTAVGTIFSGIESGRKQTEYAQNLQRGSDEIIKLSNLNSALITGGDSFPDVAAFFAGDPKNGYMTLSVMNSSETPLYDLKLQVTDQQTVEAKMKVLLAEGKQNQISKELQALKHNFTIGTLSPKQLANLLTVPFDTNLKFLRFSIESSARNGNFRQIIEFFNVENQWLLATRTYRPGDGIVKNLKEQIDPRIPKELLKSL